MAVIRIEIPVTRDEAKKIRAVYSKGSDYRPAEDQAIAEAWKHDRTPTGKVTFCGVTNGQPPSLKYDVEVHTDLERPGQTI